MPTLAELLAGRPQLGRSGIDIMNSIAQANAGQAPPSSQYIGMTDDGEHRRYSGQNGVGSDGSITRNGRTYVQVGAIPDDGRILDHAAVEYDPEFGLITPRENVHVEESTLDKIMPYLVAAGFAGPAIGAAMGGGEAAAAGTGAFDVGGSAGFGGTIPLEAGAAGGSAALPSSYWSALADSGGIASDAGVAGGSSIPMGEMGGATAGTGGALSGGGSAVADSGAFDMGGSSGFGGSTYTAPGVGDYISGGASRALDAAAANPMGAARGALGLASVLAGVSRGNASPSGLTGSAGDVNSIIAQMAAANRVNQTSPFGSRTWSQGPDGQWGVTDAFSPQEQANYEGVRGMNADVTSMAQQKLAALMSQPSHSRAAPFQWAGRTIGG